MAAQASLNVSVRAQAQFVLPGPSPPPTCGYYTECTGLGVRGHEVAVVGHMQGLWVVDTQPAVEGTGGPITVPMGSPQLHVRGHPGGDKPAPWHDVAAYRYQPSPTVEPRHFVFGVVDSYFQAHPGLQVLEITRGPNPSDPVQVASNTLWFDDPVTRHWDNAHTLFVDPERGWLYVTRAYGGQSLDQSLWVFRISDFDNTAPPALIAHFPGYRVHETFARKDRAYLATEANPLDQGPVWDVMDLTAPPASMMLSITPQWLAAPDPHTLWVSEDEKLVAATVEAQPGLLLLYNVASPPVTSDPRALVSTWSKYPHAPHIVWGIGRTLYVTHYTDGLHVLDATVPANPIDFAYHDTYTFHDIDADLAPPALGPPLPPGPECGSYAEFKASQWYYGAWDCYPYQDSGLVYVSDTRGGLFILEIEKGHFLRSQDAFPLSTWRTPPNLHPHGATPKQNATGFQFRVTGVTALAAYQILIGTQTSSVPVGPIKRYVEINHPNTVILTGFAAPSGDTLHAWTPQSPQPGQTLYAQIIELGGTPAVPVAASRQIRFKLL